MKRFEYIRALEPQQAVMFATPKEASFIAGGTNLLDLMKFEIETPTKLVDVTRLELEQIEETADGGLLQAAHGHAETLREGREAFIFSKISG